MLPLVWSSRVRRRPRICPDIVAALSAASLAGTTFSLSAS